MQYVEDGSYQVFQTARMQGRLLVILAGFDEAGMLERRLAREIQQTSVNDVFLVLTSREVGAPSARTPSSASGACG